MTIAFPCEKCGKKFEVDQALAGKKCKCKQCGHIFLIPVPRQSSTAPKGVKTFGATDGAPASRPASARPAPRRPAPASSPSPVADPYGFAEARSRSIPTADLDDDEEFLPPRPGKPISERKPRKRSGGFSIENIPGWAYLVLGALVLVAIVAAFTSHTGMAVVWGGVLVIAFIAMAVGSIGLLIVAFQEGLMCGLMYVFLPFYGLYYVISRWEDTKRWFVLCFGGWLLMMGSAVIPAFRGAKLAAEHARMRQQGIPVPGLDSDPFESFAHRKVDALNQAADLLATVHDINSAHGAVVQYNELRDTIDECDQGIKNLPNADPLNSIRVGAIYGPRLKAAGDRLDEQTQRLRTLPGIMAALDDARGVHLAQRGIGGAPGPGAFSLPTPEEAIANREAKGASSNSFAIDPPRSESIDKNLSDLESTDLQTRKQAVGRLRRAPLMPDRRSEVAKAIEPLLQEEDMWVRGDAAKTLATWGGPENVPALLAALKNEPEFSGRWAILDALKALKDPQAAEPLARMVAENKERGKAVETLKAIGPGAEDAVLPLLSSGEESVRSEACKILQVIATEKSVPKLRDLALRSPGWDKQEAREALNAMSLRNINVDRNSTEGPGTSRSTNANPDSKESPFKKKSQIFKRKKTATP